ncbi:hypothetical protein ACTI_37770 [Actinoplanes sp. OR16]|uniref:hypothetical protein n=1 Tax=Actinoplanes sp. OR16 TaxID=946334 RepID=UPI000F700A66|nr:hypothetical protein [Actinoplanes sp. OR16]BBH67092.1 hypothetical protein ACTI_37770 [Actinoplanes sp. OR16]
MTTTEWRIRGRDRAHQFPGRHRRVLIRLSDEEHDLLSAAAAAAELTPTGYAAAAALAAAAGAAPPETDAEAEELRALLRQLMAARSAVARLAEEMRSTTGTRGLDRLADRCAKAVAAVDDTSAAVRRRLR